MTDMVVIIMETTVGTKYEQYIIKNDMDALTGADKWSIDIEDSQKVLRVVAGKDITPQISDILSAARFSCSIMDIFISNNR